MTCSPLGAVTRWRWFPNTQSSIGPAGLSIVRHGPAAPLCQGSGSCSMATGYWPPWPLRDTGLAMSEEPTTLNLIELTRRLFSLVNEGDFDGMMSFFGAYSLWDVTPWGL